MRLTFTYNLRYDTAVLTSRCQANTQVLCTIKSHGRTYSSKGHDQFRLFDPRMEAGHDADAGKAP